MPAPGISHSLATQLDRKKVDLELETNWKSDCRGGRAFWKHYARLLFHTGTWKLQWYDGIKQEVSG